MTALFEPIRDALARRPPQLQDAGPEARWAAVALVLAPAGDGAPQALLIRRAEREGDPWSGHVALPGGRREPADLDLLTTARRETREETGVDLDAALYLGQLDDLHPTRGIRPPIVVRPYVFAFARKPALRPNWEVAESLWTPLEALRAGRVTSRIHVGDRARDVPSLLLGPHVLWGMTLRIVDGFLGRLD